MQEDRMRWPTNLQKSCHTIRPPRSQRFSVCRGFWSLHLGIGQSCEFCQTIHVSRGPSFFRNLLKSPVSRIPSIPSIGWRHPLLHHQGALQRSGIGAPWASVIGMSQNVLPVLTVLIYMFYSGLYVSYSGLYMFLFRSHFAKDPKGFHLVGPLLTVRVDMICDVGNADGNQIGDIIRDGSGNWKNCGGNEGQWLTMTVMENIQATLTSPWCTSVEDL